MTAIALLLLACLGSGGMARAGHVVHMHSNVERARADGDKGAYECLPSVLGTVDAEIVFENVGSIRLDDGDPPRDGFVACKCTAGAGESDREYWRCDGWVAVDGAGQLYAWVDRLELHPARTLSTVHITFLSPTLLAVGSVAFIALLTLCCAWPRCRDARRRRRPPPIKTQHE